MTHHLLSDRLRQDDAVALDDLPWPERGDINYRLQVLSTASVLASRGCPWKCSFSIITFYEGNGTRGRRRRDPIHVVEEMEYLAGGKDARE